MKFCFACENRMCVGPIAAPAYSCEVSASERTFQRAGPLRRRNCWHEIVSIRMSKIVNDRAIWPTVAVAVRGEMAQRIGHFPKLAHFRFQLFDMLQRNTLYIGRSATSIAPQSQKVANLLD